MTLKHDISQYYFLKSTIENLFGESDWYEIKECTSLSKWKKFCKKILQAIIVASESTVTIADNNWHQELKFEIERGKQHISNAKKIDEVLAALSATLTRVSFLQLGYIPQRKTLKKVTLKKQHWLLNKVRSVQYVQSKEQTKNANT